MRSLTTWILVGAMMYLVHLMAYDQGERAGMKKALSRDPVSEELELTCAGLWVGDQNKKYLEKK